MTCPEIPSPPPNCGQQPCSNAMPYNAANGAVEQRFSFLQTSFGSFDLTWYNLYPSPSDRHTGVGTNWSSSQFARCTNHNNENISAMFSPTRMAECCGDESAAGATTGGTYWFSDDSLTETPHLYPVCFNCLANLDETSSPDLWHLGEPDGTQTQFDQNNGLITMQTTPGGQETEYMHHGTYTDRVEEIRRTYSYTEALTTLEAIESRVITYTELNSVPNVQYVTLRRATDSSDPTWTEIRRIEFVYYTSDEAGKGNLGDLKLVKEQLPGTSLGTWVDDKIHMYRYYTDSESNGFKHALKYVLSPEGYERMSNPEGSSNTVLADYASAYYEYDSDRRVDKCSTQGGNVTETITFTLNSGLGTNDYTPNNWYRKAIITVADGLQRTVYSNHIAQDLLIDEKDGNDHWITYRKYNASYRIENIYHPSAVDDYVGKDNDLSVTFNTSGFVEKFTYNVDGYVKTQEVQDGSSSAIKVIEYAYTSHSAGNPSVTIYPISKRTEYRDSASGGSDSVETIFEYTYNGSTNQISTKKTKLPAVANNGPNVVDEIVETYDIVGRMTSLVDARGIETTYAYDENNGAVLEMTQDAGTGGMGLVTTYENDELGRQTQSLGPSHDIDGTAIRTASWTIYKDDDNEVWTGRGYKNGMDYTLINPVTIVKMDKNDREVDVIDAKRGTGVEDSGKLTTSNTFPQSSWVHWNQNIYGDGGRMTARRVFFNIPSSGSIGSSDYDETEYGYDAVSRQNMQKTPAGTISRSVFDVRGLVESVWIGADDNGATNSDPTGGGSSGNNMEKVTQNEYDGGFDGGDGNLTKVTKPVNDTSVDDRIAEMEYDWRDRLVKTIVTENSSRKFQTVNTLDNLDRVTVSETERGTGTPVLIAKSEALYDTRGRVYQTKVYGVNDAGSAGANPLVSNTWFDPNNNVIKSQPAGSEAFLKTVYDSLNRPTNTYYGYYSGSGTDSPDSLVDNVIFSETATEYDDANNSTEATTKQRNHDATGTGALNGPSGSQPKSRDSYVFRWYDGIGRLTEMANYGTDDITRPASPPTSSDTILVSKQVYNADGELEDVIDPLDKTDRTIYDAASRVTKVTLNHGGSETEVTNTEYEGGLMSKQIAENSETGNQETLYTYGVSLTNSKIASNDLLQKITYPDAGEVSFEYNRQGDQIEMTDQNDSVHEYGYDQLGRKIKDAVTLAGGSSVDNSVLRIETSYDDRMRIQNIKSYDATTGGNVESDVEREYNDFNQLTKEYQQHGSSATGSSANVQYAYENGSDNNIRQTSMTYPAVSPSRVLNFDYGSGGDNDMLSRVEKLKIGTNEIVDYSYLGMNRVVIQKYTEPTTDVEFTLATGSGNDPYTALDRFDRITNLLWQVTTGRELIDYDYIYDRVGNKLTQEVKNSSVNVDELYGYDGLYRLSEYDRGDLSGGTISNPALTQDWTLDQTGNWLNFIQGVVDPLNQDREHTKANEIELITKTVGDDWPTPAYDANGNTTEMPQPADLEAYFDVTWDAWNRLVKLKDGANTVAEYEYDGLGRRIIKKIYSAGTLTETRHQYLSNQNQLLEERVDSSSDPDQQFYWGIRYVDDLVLRDKSDTGTLDERLYALCDPRFSILAIMNDSGSVQERYSYDGYGKTSVLTPGFGNRTSSNFDWEFRYTGRHTDLESLLYYFRARYYHVELGRFISRDPIGYVDGMSLYRGYFVPNYTDPTGERCIRCRCKAIVAGGDVWGSNGWVEADCPDTSSASRCCSRACANTGSNYANDWRVCDTKPEKPGPKETCPEDWLNGTINMTECVACCLKKYTVQSTPTLVKNCYAAARPLKPITNNGTIKGFVGGQKFYKFSWKLNATQHCTTRKLVKCGVPKAVTTCVNRVCVYTLIFEGGIEWTRIRLCYRACRQRFDAQGK